MSDDDELLDRLRDALDDGLPDAPPARVAAFRAQVEAARTAAGGPQPDGGRQTSARRAIPTWLSIAAASAFVLGGIAIAIEATRDAGDGVAGNVEYDGDLCDTSGEVRGALTVTEIGIGRVVELHTDELPILPTGEYYEVWFVGPGDAADAPNRISAGTFHPDANGRSDVQFAAAVNPALYPFVEITAEPGDGNPAPSSMVVLHAEIDS